MNDTQPYPPHDASPTRLTHEPDATERDQTQHTDAPVRDFGQRMVATDGDEHSARPSIQPTTQPDADSRTAAPEAGALPRRDGVGARPAGHDDAPESRPAATADVPTGSSGEVETFDDLPDDVDLLTVQEAVALLTERGLPRNIRTVQKYCHRRALKCYRTPTENGVRYLIDRTSIDRMIDASVQQAPTGIETAEPQQAQGTPRMAPERPQERQYGPEASPMVDDRVTAILERENAFLRDQVAVKDRQLEAANARLSEANVLNQNLQDTVLQLTGNDRPRVLKPGPPTAPSHDAA